jgi:sugar fermentation stimulation protein A
MRFPFVTQPATFLERPNRYRVHARLHSTGEVIAAHCPDPGRLRELLFPGVTVHISQAQTLSRKTAYDLRFVEYPGNGQLVSLDTRLPNQLFAEGLEHGFFAPFRDFQTMEREVTLPHEADGVRSRFDFRLYNAHGRVCWIEVKSATLVVEQCALFPDAPTERGRRHVVELTRLAEAGARTAVVFIVQRPDADRFAPHWLADPSLGEALVQAHQANVELYAYTCELTLQAIQLARSIPVVLTQQSAFDNKTQTKLSLQ